MCMSLMFRRLRIIVFAILSASLLQLKFQFLVKVLSTVIIQFTCQIKKHM